MLLSRCCHLFATMLFAIFAYVCHAAFKALLRRLRLFCAYLLRRLLPLPLCY